MPGILSKFVAPEYSHMKRNPTASLSPRKKPRQRRSRDTIQTIFEATIQVLLANGFEKTTTIRIAERAGVSVGSLYQYFPNKRALLSAIVKRHVGGVVDATIAACASVHGKPIEQMCATMMAAFVAAKTRRLDISRALYLPSAAIDDHGIVKEESRRCAEAVHDMLITASDAQFEQPRVASSFLVAAIVGPTRAAIESAESSSTFDALERHLTALCVGYLREVSRTAAGQSRQLHARGPLTVDQLPRVSKVT
jgi:AcrR family transcriptional regulator